MKIAPCGPPGGGDSFCKTSGRKSYKRSTRSRHQGFLHEIILEYGEIYLRLRYCAALVGSDYRGRLVGRLSIYRIRDSMGRAIIGCFLDISTDRVNGPKSDLALDLALFDHQGKRRLIVVQRLVRVIYGLSAPPS